MKWFDKIEEIVVGGLLVLITLMVFFEVFCRFVLTSEWLTGMALASPDGIAESFVDFGRWIQIWIQEATLYLSGWMVLLGASWAVKEKAHICMDAVTTRVSAGTERIMTLISLVLCFFYCGFFLYGSFIFLQKLKKIGIELEDIPLQKWVAESVLVIGFLLLTFRFLQLGYRVFKKTETGFYAHSHAGIDELPVIDVTEGEVGSDNNTNNNTNKKDGGKQ